MRNPRAELTEKIGLRNSRNGNSGSATRVSQARKPAVSTVPPPTRPRITGDPQGYSAPPQTTASSRQPTPPIRSAAPSTSIRCRRAGAGRRSTLDVTATAAAPIGRLIRKTQRQERLSTMKPPISGPTTLAKPQTPAR